MHIDQFKKIKQMLCKLNCRKVNEWHTDVRQKKHKCSILGGFHAENSP